MTQSLNVRKFAGYAAIAAIANSIIFLIAKGADATMVVNQGGSQEIALPMVFPSTLFGLLIAASAIFLPLAVMETSKQRESSVFLDFLTKPVSSILEI